MPQKFKISPVEILGGGMNFIAETSTVKEGLFWLILNDKIKLFTAELPNEFESTLAKAKDALKTRYVVVDNLQFEITGKP